MKSWPKSFPGIPPQKYFYMEVGFKWWYFFLKVGGGKDIVDYTNPRNLMLISTQIGPGWSNLILSYDVIVVNFLK